FVSCVLFDMFDSEGCDLVYVLRGADRIRLALNLECTPFESAKRANEIRPPCFIVASAQHRQLSVARPDVEVCRAEECRLILCQPEPEEFIFCGLLHIERSGRAGVKEPLDAARGENA